MSQRQPFIVSTRDVADRTHVYPQSTEPMGPVRAIGKAAGLQRIGINIQRLPPGHRSSWPHAEENEEEFVYVLEGEVDAWVDGHLHRMRPGDIAAFPAGTGISHCFINNTQGDVLLLVGGEAPRKGSRIFYPLHPTRRQDMDPSNWWHDVPTQALGPHDGLPDAPQAIAPDRPVVGIIQDMVDLETRGWDAKDPEPFLSIIHPDMAWPFPPSADAHDPVDWVFVMGRFDRARWRRDWQALFDAHDLVHNRRATVKIEVSREQDAALAVVDIDTLWRTRDTGADFHWKGRVCKVYTKLPTGEWKFYYQTGALEFPPKAPR